jgi:di/tricarboxylate transporter
MLANVISVTDAVSGFSNEGMLTTAILFPIVDPISKTALFSKFVWLVFGSSKNVRITLLRMVVPLMIMSMFLNNTPSMLHYHVLTFVVVAMFIPVIKQWCREKELAPSLFLIPLSFSTIAGGICTLIGTSTNLVANGLMLDENLQVSQSCTLTVRALDSLNLDM